MMLRVPNIGLAVAVEIFDMVNVIILQTLNFVVANSAGNHYQLT
jgi:hypothetical protein